MYHNAMEEEGKGEKTDIQKEKEGMDADKEGNKEERVLARANGYM